MFQTDMGAVREPGGHSPLAEASASRNRARALLMLPLEFAAERRYLWSGQAMGVDIRIRAGGAVHPDYSRLAFTPLAHPEYFTEINHPGLYLQSGVSD